MIPRYSHAEMSALWSEEAKYQSWLDVELAALDAWAWEGSIPELVVASVKKRAKFDVVEIERIEAQVDHDVIAFVTCVAENIGEPDGRWLHYGLTSSDVVDTALALRLVTASELLIERFKILTGVCRDLARKYRSTPMAGRTHGMHAEPTTFGHVAATWTQAAARAVDRLQRARKMIAFGKLSGAVGTYSQTPPEVEAHACHALGLVAEPTATQVVPRDRHAEFLCQLSLAATACEQIALDIRHMQRSEVGEVAEPFGAKQKGSSAMPHKRNPIVSERICGLSRLMRSWAHAGLEDVALWHQRDISHSSVERIVLPDATITLDYMVERTIWVVSGLEVRPDAMAANMNKTMGGLYSQSVLLGLVRAGLDRDTAYRIVQRAAQSAFDDNQQLAQVLKDMPEVSEVLSDREIDSLFSQDALLDKLEVVFDRLKDTE